MLNADAGTSTSASRSAVFGNAAAPDRYPAAQGWVTCAPDVAVPAITVTDGVSELPITCESLTCSTTWSILGARRGRPSPPH